ncbi:hypothetical protein FA15DRAFT_664384 [Coprinopsis marcescibilis]|uniref:Chromo domain-containing protein n=1 Tax=Coprinopsis marcescibilis TaxID=230819 RepID=A0A5C3L8Q1_COPMA|nr:hypothetical protein FA15DRAFT_664384 [Coprinopsis marcescibilis]
MPPERNTKGAFLKGLHYAPGPYLRPTPTDREWGSMDTTSDTTLNTKVTDDDTGFDCLSGTLTEATDNTVVEGLHSDNEDSEMDAEGEDDDDNASDRAYASIPLPSVRTRLKRSISAHFPSNTKNKSPHRQSASTRTFPRRVASLSARVSSTTNKNNRVPSRRQQTTFRVNGIELKASPAFDTLWKWAAERKAIDDRRRAGLPRPWTTDPILHEYAFCNTYRVLDRVSQYIITNVIELGPQDPVEVVFRITLFNTFTKISTWEALTAALGTPHLTWASYDRGAYQTVLDTLKARGEPIYTAAFIKPAPHFGYTTNHMNHLVLLENLMQNDMPAKLRHAQSLADVYEYLVSFPGMAVFTTYQLMLNLGYARQGLGRFGGLDFVIPGPGCVSGLAKMFGASFWKGVDQREEGSDASSGGNAKNGRLNRDDATVAFATEVVRWMVQTQDEHFERLGLEFSKLSMVVDVRSGRREEIPMMLEDMEHAVCEVDKYCRKKHPGIKAHGAKGKERTEIRSTYKGPAEELVAEAPTPASSSDRSRSARGNNSGTKDTKSKIGVQAPAAYPAQPAIPKAWRLASRRVLRVRPGALVVEKRYEVNRIGDHRWVDAYDVGKGRWLMADGSDDEEDEEEASERGSPGEDSDEDMKVDGAARNLRSRKQISAVAPVGQPQQQRKIERKRQFFVYWTGYADEAATWEWEQSLIQDAPLVVKEYLEGVGAAQARDGGEDSGGGGGGEKTKATAKAKPSGRRRR